MDGVQGPAQERLRSPHLLMMVVLSSLVSAIVASTNLMAVQGARLAERVGYRYVDVCVARSPEACGAPGGCAVVAVSLVRVCAGERCVDTRLLVPLSQGRGGLAPRAPGEGVSLGRRLAEVLGVKKGGVVEVAGVRVPVAAVHSPRSVDDLAVVAPSPLAGVDFYEVRCPESGPGLLVEYVSLLNGQVAGLVEGWLLSSVAVFLTVSYVATLKLFVEVRGELAALHELGAPLGSLAFSAVATTALLALVGAVVGASFGLVSTHAATWLLRVFGVLSLAKPFLTAPDVALLTAAACLSALASSYLSFRSVMGGEPW